METAQDKSGIASDLAELCLEIVEMFPGMELVNPEAVRSLVKPLETSQDKIDEVSPTVPETCDASCSDIDLGPLKANPSPLWLARRVSFPPFRAVGATTASLLTVQARPRKSQLAPRPK